MGDVGECVPEFIHEALEEAHGVTIHRIPEVIGDVEGATKMAPRETTERVTSGMGIHGVASWTFDATSVRGSQRRS